MECATVLARRGMELVHLADAGDDIGGCMRWVTRLPGLGEWGHVIAYRRALLAKLDNLEFAASTPLDADAVRDYGAQIVVVATGARWAGDGLNGFTRAPIPGADASLAHVLTPEQVMVESKPVPGSRAIVLDLEGYFTGAGIAEKLVQEGHHVELVTCFDAVAPYCDQTLEGYRLRGRLHQLGIGMHRGVLPVELSASGLVGDAEFGRRLELKADAVVLVTQRVSDDGLYRELASDPAALEQAGVEAVYAIGDCVAPRLIADAIFDGHRLAREIDSPDPSRPLPYQRERPLVGVSALT